MRPRTSAQRQAGGILICTFRQAAQLSQRQLADLIGVSHAAVCQWERGKRSVPVDRWASIIEVCGRSDADLRLLVMACTGGEA